jgi:hypothetical protein
MEMIALTESVADISEVSLDLLFEQPVDISDISSVNTISFFVFFNTCYSLF